MFTAAPAPDSEEHIAMEAGPKSLKMTVLMTPDLANFSGGRRRAAEASRSGRICMRLQYCRAYVVTVFVDQVHFGSRSTSEIS